MDCSFYFFDPIIKKVIKSPKFFDSQFSVPEHVVRLEFFCIRKVES